MASAASRVARRPISAAEALNRGRQMIAKGRNAFGKGRQAVDAAIRTGGRIAAASGAQITISPREYLRRWKQHSKEGTLRALVEERARTIRKGRLRLSEKEIILREQILKAIMSGEIKSWEHLGEVVKEIGISQHKWKGLFTKTERSMIWDFYNPNRHGHIIRIPSPH